MVERDDVIRWVGEYERAWREADAVAVGVALQRRCVYRGSPYDPPEIGHEAIRSFWTDDVGRSFTMDAGLVAVDGDTAVVRVDVSYLTPRAQDYRDLWILRFGPDGRVTEFEEWAYWPGRSSSAAGDHA